ncbi:MAG: FtsX-like permease family protein [Acidobacteria bacterium]|nr:FtsX-like permease family protein [Acidobacteriota bacterium]
MVFQTLRQLVRQPGFSLPAVVLLAAAIGANAGVFSLINAVLLRSLPFESPDSLLWIWAARVDRDRAFFSLPDFVDLAARNRTLSGFEAFANWGVTRVERGERRRLTGLRVTPGLFDLLGVRPALGRMLRPADAGSGERLVVLSHGTWLRDYGGSPAIVNQRIQLNDEFYTVIGVAPREFFFPGADGEMFTMLDPYADPLRGDRGTNFLRAMGRLKPGAGIATAREDLAVISEDLKRLYPVPNAKKTAPNVFPLHDEITGPYRAALHGTGAAVALVLLLGCVNLGNLLLVRVIRRAAEFRIRLALGAGMRQLVTQVLAEPVAIFAAALPLGAAAGIAIVSACVRWAPVEMPRLREASLDLTVFVYLTALALGGALVCSIAPAAYLHLRRTPAWAGRAAIVVETASCVFLLTFAVDLVSFLRQPPDAGFEPAGKVHSRLSLPVSELPKFLTALDAGGLVAATNALPLSGLNVRTDFEIDGAASATAAEQPGAQQRFVSPNYFDVLAVPIRRGRAFTRFDNQESKPVAIVDETAARMFWKDREPLGSHIRIGETRVEIAGIAGAVRHFSMEEPLLPTIYLPAMQTKGLNSSFLASSLSVVAASTPQQLSGAIRGASSLASIGTITQTPDLIDRALKVKRFQAWLLGGFSVIALLLSIAGTFSVVGLETGRRRREYGIRLAIGATPSQLVAEGVRRPLRDIAIGAGLGCLAALAFTQHSPLPAATLCAAVAALAALIPVARIPAATSIYQCVNDPSGR